MRRLRVSRASRAELEPKASEEIITSSAQHVAQPTSVRPPEDDYEISASTAIVASILGFLVLAASGWEYAAATDVSKRSSSALASAKAYSSSTCDRVAAAAELNRYAATKVTVQWRRGLIIGVAVAGLLSVLGFNKSGLGEQTRDCLIIVLVVWVAAVSVQGFADYHLREVATNGIDQLLTIAKSGLDQTSCTTNVFYESDLHGRSFKSLRDAKKHSLVNPMPHGAPLGSWKAVA